MTCKRIDIVRCREHGNEVANTLTAVLAQVPGQSLSPRMMARSAKVPLICDAQIPGQAPGVCRVPQSDSGTPLRSLSRLRPIAAPPDSGWLACTRT